MRQPDRQVERDTECERVYVRDTGTEREKQREREERRIPRTHTHTERETHRHIDRHKREIEKEERMDGQRTRERIFTLFASHIFS